MCGAGCMQGWGACEGGVHAGAGWGTCVGHVHMHGRQAACAGLHPLHLGVQARTCALWAVSLQKGLSSLTCSELLQTEVEFFSNDEEK